MTAGLLAHEEFVFASFDMAVALTFSRVYTKPRESLIHTTWYPTH